MSEGKSTEQFVRLLADAHQEVLRYVLAMVPNGAEAHEVLQDTAVALWQKFDEYDAGQPFVPWACRFAYRHVLKHRHRMARQGMCLSLEALEHLAAERLEQADLLEERRRALSRCLEGLSEEERQLVEHRYAHRPTVRQLAEKTGCSVHTLYSLLERIRRKLFQCVNGIVGAEGRA